MMIFSLALGLIGLYFLVKSQPSLVPIKQPTALEILRRRYAAGQITREEFLILSRDLQ
ncbi:MULTISPECIES: SHOCT domain-containing protein [unclassified Sphaerochaeta]|jgi:putative membrane protein|uniref:SHOCT domain-containing protein n=1 Tax=unclassified Sphaerochaeta TaxID=2637943 RepID=UPI000A7B53E2|nr:SHOCT domain-containing protein [Sphaerochaeta sp. UBA5856]HPE94010.1 SHOCT domain-containing protein [Sphaerochaeta sp.]